MKKRIIISMFFISIVVYADFPSKDLKFNELKSLSNMNKKLTQLIVINKDIGKLKKKDTSTDEYIPIDVLT